MRRPSLHYASQGPLVFHRPSRVFLGLCGLPWVSLGLVAARLQHMSPSKIMRSSGEDGLDAELMTEDVSDIVRARVFPVTNPVTNPCSLENTIF